MNKCEHDWERVGEDTCGDVFWCSRCGALMSENPTEVRVPTNAAIVKE